MQNVYFFAPPIFLDASLSTTKIFGPPKPQHPTKGESCGQKKIHSVIKILYASGPSAGLRRSLWHAVGTQVGQLNHAADLSHGSACLVGGAHTTRDR